MSFLQPAFADGQPCYKWNQSEGEAPSLLFFLAMMAELQMLPMKAEAGNG